MLSGNPVLGAHGSELRTLKDASAAYLGGTTVTYDPPMDALALGLQRLGAARTKQQLVDALWDLRDSAYDQPPLWVALTGETLL